MKPRSDKDKMLVDPPEHPISCVKFLPPSNGEENLLVAASWDASLTLYDFKRNVNVQYETDDMPVLSISPMSPNSICYGGLGKTVCVKDVGFTEKNGKAVTIGHHNDTICSVSYNKLHNIVVSGGYDSTIRLWNTQQNKGNTCVGTITTDKQVLCMDVRDNLVAAGISGGFISMWDLRNISSRLKVSEVKDSLNVQCIAIFPDKKRIVYGTSEGRASIEGIDPKDSKGDFLFKPHVDKSKLSHPVNTVCFVEDSSRFLMGGSDGKLRIWDPDTRKLVADFPVYPNEIAAVDVSASGGQAVVACSYLDDREVQEDTEILPPAIFVRSISEYVNKTIPLSGGNNSKRSNE